MSKLKIIKKLSAIPLAVVAFSAAGMFLSTGEASAAWGCTPGNTPTANWAIHDGEQAHGMAGLNVRVRDVNNKPLDNVVYELRSDVPGMSGNITTENNEVVDVDYRIFKWKHSPNPNPTFDGRTNAKNFRSNEELYLKTEAGADINPSPERCSGWSVLGPGERSIRPSGAVDQWGNEWVLDCQQPDSNGDGQPEYTDFWISSISTPSGPDGEWGGRWEVITPKRIGQGSGTNSRFLDTGSNKFNVTNGESRQVTLVWHPNPRPDYPPFASDCTFIQVGGSKLNRRKVEVTRISGGDKFYDGNPDGTHGGNINAWVPSPPGEEVDGSHTKRWNYKAKDRTIHIKITQSAWNGSAWVDTVLRDDNVVCYDATCDISMIGNVIGKPSGVQSGSEFNVTAHVHNRANPPNATPLYAQVDGRPLILASNDGSPVGFWYNPGAPDGLARGVHSWQTWNLREPGNLINNYNIGAKLYYDFNGAPGIQPDDFVVADCTPATYGVFKQFDLSVSTSVDLAPTSEDPTSVTYTGRADPGPLYGIPSDPPYHGSIGVDYTGRAKRKLHGGPDQTINAQAGRRSTPIVYQWSFDPRPNHAGDRYYMNADDFCVAQTIGWIGPGNDFSTDTTGNCGQSAEEYIYDRPYMHVYGADVMAGSSFRDGETCTAAASAKIDGFRSTAAGKSGSGVQFAALAMDQIAGFASASVRGSSPTWPTGLTFANVDSGDRTGSLGEDRPKDGGFYAGQAMCAQDFYDTLKEDPLPISGASTNPAALSSAISSGDGKPKQFLRNGNLTIFGGNIDEKATVFVNGNVTIRGNITFPVGGYLSIFAKGNIYIDRSVSRIDGFYVAQPRDDGSRGIIYTCTNASSPYGINNLYNNCRANQLVINGAFAAQDVKFLRVANSLRDSCRREFVLPFASCGPSRAAEVFNFSPELYLNAPIFEDVSAGQPYQYITTLPPVL